MYMNQKFSRLTLKSLANRTMCSKLGLGGSTYIMRTTKNMKCTITNKDSKRNDTN